MIRQIAHAWNMHSALFDACKWLGREISARPEEIYAAHPGRGDMILTAMLGHGLVLEQDGRIGLSDTGRNVARTERPVHMVDDR